MPKLKRNGDVMKYDVGGIKSSWLQAIGIFCILLETGCASKQEDNIELTQGSLVLRQAILTADDAEWVAAELTSDPPVTDAGAISITQAGANIVLYSGSTCTADCIGPTTWEWDGSAWHQKFPVHVPPGRWGPNMATLGGKAVLFGGSGFNDTWEWDGNDWTEKTPSVSPTPGLEAIATYGNKILLFGGWDTQPMNETWEWDGENWTQLFPANSPPARSGHKMATIGSSIVLFGGLVNSQLDPVNDTWEWNGIDWIERTPAHSPAARFGHVMATLGTRVILFGGTNGSGLYSDTWEWDGTDWTFIELTYRPSKRDACSMTATGTNSALMYGGGDKTAGDLYDTWIFSVKSERLELGSECKSLGECLSQYCVDGVCCDSPCQRACETCNLPGYVGQCVPDTREHTCQQFPIGASCVADADCEAAFCVDGVCCNSLCNSTSQGELPGKKKAVGWIGRGCAAVSQQDIFLLALILLIFTRSYWKARSLARYALSG